MSIESEARAATTDRARGYNADGLYFPRVAAMWSAITGVQITPIQVCLMMISLKSIRLANAPDHHDSLTDIIGYAMCAEREMERDG